MADRRKLIDNQELLGMYSGNRSGKTNVGAAEFMDSLLPGKGIGATVYAHLTRSNDPETSRAGAVDAAKRLGKMQAEALKAVMALPGRTCSELETLASRRGRTYGRRLGELERLGKVKRCATRPCTVTGRSAATWEAI